LSFLSYYLVCFRYLYDEIKMHYIIIVPFSSANFGSIRRPCGSLYRLLTTAASCTNRRRLIADVDRCIIRSSVQLRDTRRPTARPPHVDIAEARRNCRRNDENGNYFGKHAAATASAAAAGIPPLQHQQPRLRLSAIVARKNCEY